MLYEIGVFRNFRSTLATETLTIMEKLFLNGTKRVATDLIPPNQSKSAFHMKFSFQIIQTTNTHFLNLKTQSYALAFAVKIHQVQKDKSRQRLKATKLSCHRVFETDFVQQKPFIASNK